MFLVIIFTPCELEKTALSLRDKSVLLIVWKSEMY